jgi:predicted Ser/Thr protein kinase
MPSLHQRLDVRVVCLNIRVTDWTRIEAAFDALLALPASERQAALPGVCGDDDALRREVESLLAQVDGEDPVLDRPLLTSTGLPEAADSLSPDTRIGAYRLVGLIGRGGMGEVYRAERADGQYSQAVALKLIRRELAHQTARFQVERQTLARLDHPGIAHLLDGGVADDGRPFMVMELVEGSNLIDWCREHHSDLDERLTLFLAVCAALEYAHRNLVVHRDLKPDNVIVTADGTVKLLDFGIAKLLGAADAGAQTQHAPMTPGYAAPEQLLQGSITTATDVYALGMLLFELLTGQQPWNLRELSLAAGIDKAVREVPRSPSAVAESVSDPPIPARLLQGDLDAIVAKALRKEPERRYGSVAALRVDVERSRQHHPVEAREGARLYAAGRFLRRHRALAASILLTGAVLLAGIATTLWQARAARLEADKADAVRDFLLDIFQHNSVNNPDGAQARQTTAEQLLDIGAQRIRTGLQSQPQVRGQVMEVLAELYDELEKFDKVEEIERTHLADIVQLGDRPSADKATAQWHLGRTLVMRGDYPAATAELTAAIRTMDAINDHGSERRSESLLELGRMDYHRGTPESLSSAVTYAQESLAVYQKIKTPTEPTGLFALQLMARVAERRGKYPEAERLYQEFITQARASYFDSAPLLRAHGSDDLGSLLLVERRYREAEPELRQAIQIYSRTEGERAMDTAADEAFLGQLLVATNRGAEGVAKLRDALSSVEESQGEDNLPTTCVLRLRLAQAEISRGNLASARTLLDRNVAAYEAKNPKDRNHFPENLLWRAQLERAQGHDDQAMAELDRADQLWPADDPMAPSRVGLGRIVSARIAVAAGRFSDADRSALEKMRARAPATDNQFAAAYFWATLTLADADREQHRTAESVARSQGLLDWVLAQPEHEFYADWEARTRQALGKALQQQGKITDAQAQLLRAVQLRELFDDPSGIWLAQARAALAAARR